MLVAGTTATRIGCRALADVVQCETVLVDGLPSEVIILVVDMPYHSFEIVDGDNLY
eukprot:SAG31_NODE_69_length_28130_cov_15.318219_17_plen_56_part_00